MYPNFYFLQKKSSAKKAKFRQTIIAKIKVYQKAVPILLFLLTSFHLTAQTESIPLDFNELKNQLLNAPMEGTTSGTDALHVVEIPGLSGKLTIEVWQSPLLSPDFASTYPQLKTFSFRGVDDPFVTGRITLTPTWVNIFVISDQGSYVIRPENLNSPTNYLLEPEWAENSIDSSDHCGFQSEWTANDKTKIERLSEEINSRSLLTFSNGAIRRSYNLAIVLTAEFHDANGGTVPSAVAVATTAVNNIQAIYDRELAIRFVLQIPFVYTDSTTDPFIPDTNMGANSRNCSGC